MDLLHSPIVGIAGAILIFGLAIFAHELGHFTLAKLTGVGVKEFAIGMGPQLFKFVKGETVYSIRAIPFGGFVMLEGAFPEDEEEEKKQGEDNAGKSENGKKKDVASSIMEDVNALRDRGTFVKISIFLAGVFFNYLAATFAMGLHFTLGVTENEPFPAQFAEVHESTPMYEAGLRSLDSILEVDGTRAETWEDFSSVIAQRMKQKDAAPIELLIERDGETLTVEIPTPYNPEEPKKHSAAYNNLEDPEYISLTPTLPPYIDRMVPNYPAEKAEIKKGDLIVAVNGVPVTYSYEVRNMIMATPGGEALEIEVRRGNETVLCYPVPDDDWEGKMTPTQIGVLFGMPRAGRVKEPILKAFSMAPKRTALFTVKIAGLTFETFGKLVTDFRGTKKQLSGPVGIMTMAYKASRQGIERFRELFILLNLALLVFNLLPIPILDGGHIAICIIEGVTRRRIPPLVLAWTFTAMFILLISFAVLITYQDVLTWWVGI